MSEYVVLSRLTNEGRKTLKTKPERLKEVNLEISKMGAKVVYQYALLGKYDFLTILEAPDNETVAKIMVELGSRGTLETTTLAAIEIDDFLKALK
ncbi:MAG TPA: GYD domain-containing protein [Methanomassiliicoccales archaeon]|nr:GYD domain-containing protein [Methanomassiliicoccales archaeon]